MLFIFNHCFNWIYIFYFVGNHLNEYAALGHPYISSYSLTDSLNWVLCMNPLMAKLLSEADFIEADITYKVSVEIDYLFNVVTFNYATMKCKPCHACILTQCITYTIFQQGWLLLGSDSISWPLRRIVNVSRPFSVLWPKFTQASQWENHWWGFLWIGLTSSSMG